MYEKVYTILSVDDNNKRINVELHMFPFGSIEARKAKLEEKKIYAKCCTEGYEVFYNEKLVERFEKAKSIFNYNQQQKKVIYSFIEENEKKLIEIEEKDILDLTEEEIILLAKFNVEKRKVNKINGIQVPVEKITFEEEYQKIIDLIEEKKNAPKM